jgi:UDP-2,3-diacylglucosamine pyrophosphatase LpxH
MAVPVSCFGRQVETLMQHTVVISDVHFCEGVPGNDLWMRWRQMPFFPDQEFADLVDVLLAEVKSPDDVIELVFNGDLFDFDAGRVVDGVALFEDLPRSEPVSADLIDRILIDHQGFVDAVAKFLKAGNHRVVFVSGNHDPQLAYDAVRRRIRHAIADAAQTTDIAHRIVFRAWFHKTPDNIHVEHGNQYDPYCSFRYPMVPQRPMPGTSEPEIQPTVGSVAFRYMASRMGYFNPHVDQSFLLSFPEYLAHWSKHYLFTQRALAKPFLQGLVRLFSQLISLRDPGSRDRAAHNIRTAAQENGVDPVSVARHAALFSRPAEDALHKVVREFWVDRVLLGVASAAAVTVPLIARKNRIAVGMAIGVPAILAAYEYAVPRTSLDDNWKAVTAMSPRIAEIYGSPAVIFGHTHIPYGEWRAGVFHGNSGTWSAAYQDVECTIPADKRGKPVIWLRNNGHDLQGGLYRWNRMQLLPDLKTDENISTTSVSSHVAASES